MNHPIRGGQKLIIETPELIPLEFTLAGVGSRFLALAIDLAIQMGVTFVLLAPVMILYLTDGLPFSENWVMAIVVLALFAIQYVYFAGFEIAWRGQTPGKRKIGLRVMGESGLPIGIYEALARNIVRLVDAIPGFYAVGIASVLIAPKSQRLGDLVAGTVVVHEVPHVEAAFLADPERRSTGLAVPSLDRVGRLSPTELHLVETFLERRVSMDPEARRDMATRIMARLRHKLGEPDTGSDPERTLESVARLGRRVAEYR